jgi:uncharacterized protein YlxW (UPF0749 family)
VKRSSRVYRHSFAARAGIFLVGLAFAACAQTQTPSVSDLKKEADLQKKAAKAKEEWAKKEERVKKLESELQKAREEAVKAKEDSEKAQREREAFRPKGSAS